MVEDVKVWIDVVGLFGDMDEFFVRVVVGYGYMGDVNLYFNVFMWWFDEWVEKVLELYVYEWIVER